MLTNMPADLTDIAAAGTPMAHDPPSHQGDDGTGDSERERQNGLLLKTKAA